MLNGNELLGSWTMVVEFSLYMGGWKGRGKQQHIRVLYQNLETLTHIVSEI